MNWRRTALLIPGALVVAGGMIGVQADAATTQTHRINRVILDAGNLDGRTLSSGYTTIEQKRVWCGFGSCTMAMSIMASVSEATCRDEWAIVGLVDGNSVDGGPLLETLPTAGNQQTHTWQGIYTTNEGYHTLTFQIYLPCSANANQWSVRYLNTDP